jgi:dihydroorotase
MKMHPPFRPRQDVEACRRGLLDGTIDCIVTDHAPHTVDEKAAGFLKAPPGIVGLETALGLAAHEMVESGMADWPRFIEWFTTGPAKVLKRDLPSIRQGSTANLTLIDPQREWKVDPSRFLSKGRNTPFAGWTLFTYPVATVSGHAVIRHNLD